MNTEKIQFAKSVAEWNRSHQDDSHEMDASKIAEVNREIAEIEKQRRKLEEAKAHEAKYTESEVDVKDIVII